MKKYILLLLVFLICPLTIFAKETKKEDKDFALICDNTKISINDEIVCRLSVDKSFVYDQINYKIKLDDGLILEDVRSNYEKMWTVNKKSAKSKELISGLQEFGILLIKASSSGNQKIKITNISLNNSSNNESKELKDVELEVKVISDSNSLKEIKINDKKLSEFDKDIYNYDYYIDKETNIKVEATSDNEFSTISGTGEIKLSEQTNRFVLPITVESESGNNKIYVLNIIRKDSKNNKIDKTLESLTIKNDKDNTIIFSLKKEIYDYNIIVDDNVKSLSFSPVLSNDKNKFVSGYGKQTIKLKSGDNIVLIKVIDEEKEELTYTINITKPIANLSSNAYLKSLEIKETKIKFNKKVKKYNIEVNKKVKELNIKAIPDDANSIVKISGNNNLKDGSIVKISVTAPNQTKNIYYINVTLKGFNYTPMIIVILLAVLTYFIVVLMKKNKELLIKTKEKFLTKTINIKDIRLNNEPSDSIYENNPIITENINEENKEINPEERKISSINEKTEILEEKELPSIASTSESDENNKETELKSNVKKKSTNTKKKSSTNKKKVQTKKTTQTNKKKTTSGSKNTQPAKKATNSSKKSTTKKSTTSVVKTTNKNTNKKPNTATKKSTQSKKKTPSKKK